MNGISISGLEDCNLHHSEPGLCLLLSFASKREAISGERFDVGRTIEGWSAQQDSCLNQFLHLDRESLKMDPNV